MPYLNTVVVLGRLGRDAEVRSTQTGKQVASFSLAVTEKWKDAGGSPQERTSWLDCVKWEPPSWMQGELIKGALVLVQGRLQQRTYEHNGQKRSAIEIVADTVQFPEAKKSDRKAGPAVTDDVPFGRMR